MADAEKESQRAALHKAIWGIADEVRGAVDGWDFKMYILGFLFYRFISEDLAEFVDAGEHDSGDLDFSYAALSDDEAYEARDGIIEEKGYFLLPSELFANVTARCDRDPDLNETLKSIFDHIEGSSIGTRSEKSFRGLFDDIDLNSSKLGNGVAERNQRLVKIMKGIASLNFGSIEDSHIDLFGDAYEYLMNMYASSAGKSGGEFFTPQEVSELLARIVIGDRTDVNKVYDPACGSGSLLLRFARILGQENVRRGFFGQEINITTYNLARINMFLHKIPFDKFDIALGDTLMDPKHWDDEPFDAIVSNPPYSIKWAGD
ncbi:type I restriction-modification system subunit M, partial [Bifidobacterium pullorum]|uniref:type I restriction-modification system subunit M n=1 Tax=Bifidobacterium pullorum TaxID=78448 RepID=UPI00388D8266